MQEEVARTVSQDRHCFRPLVRQLGFFKTFMSALPFAVAYVVISTLQRKSENLMSNRILFIILDKMLY